MLTVQDTQELKEKYQLTSRQVQILSYSKKLVQGRISKEDYQKFTQLKKPRHKNAYLAMLFSNYLLKIEETETKIDYHNLFLKNIDTSVKSEIISFSLEEDSYKRLLNLCEKYEQDKSRIIRFCIQKIIQEGEMM